jgi:hypothetical protein
MRYKISTYQNFEPITDIGEFANGSKQAKRGNKPVCLYNWYRSEDNWSWWWHLDDGHLDVGPFLSEEMARIDCLETLGHHVKPLANGSYRLTTGNYRVELESLDAVMDHLAEQVAA